MSEESIVRLMKALIYAGLVLVIVAISLAVFGELHVSMGVQGVMIVAGVAGTGLLLLLPAKIFLTFLLMKREQDQHEVGGKK